MGPATQNISSPVASHTYTPYPLSAGFINFYSLLRCSTRRLQQYKSATQQVMHNEQKPVNKK